MIRVVLTVALAVAVLGVSLPAVQQAAVHRGDAATRAAVEKLVTSARALAADSDALSPDLPTARRVVELDLPTSGRARAGLQLLHVGPPEPVASGTGGRNGTRIVWRVDDGAAHVRQVPGIRLRAPPGAGRARAATVTLRAGGHRRVALELVRVDGHRVVWVRLPSRRCREARVQMPERGHAGPCSRCCPDWAPTRPTGGVSANRQWRATAW